MNANSPRSCKRTSLGRAASAAFAIAVLASGCGPGHPNSATPTSPSATYGHHRHHRRHGRHSYSGGNGVAVAGGAAVAGGTAVAAAAHPAASGGGPYPCNDAQFLSDQSQFASGSLHGDQEVDVCGTVTNVLAEKDTRSGLHGYYDLQVAPGSVIEIVSDLGEMNAPAWPWVRVGDYSYVQGRYYYDSPSSQGIDWTHHGTSRSWPIAGYVVVAGTQYQ